MNVQRSFVCGSHGDSSSNRRTELKAGTVGGERGIERGWLYIRLSNDDSVTEKKRAASGYVQPLHRHPPQLIVLDGSRTYTHSDTETDTHLHTNKYTGSAGVPKKLPWFWSFSSRLFNQFTGF